MPKEKCEAEHISKKKWRGRGCEADMWHTSSDDVARPCYSFYALGIVISDCKYSVLGSCWVPCSISE